MSDVKWIKIATDIFDDEKILLIEAMPDADSLIVIWFKLLCLAGKQNNSGVFVMSNGIPYTDKMLSTIFRRDELVITLALHTFEQFGMVEIIDDTVTIPKWGKHQTLDKIEAKNEYQRQYMSNYRKRQKQLAEGTEPLKNKDNSNSNRKTNCKPNGKANVSSLDKNKIRKEINTCPNAFDSFWTAYPKKQGKADAIKAWDKLNPDSDLMSKIIEAVNRYKATDSWQRDGGQYIPLPATFIRGRRWEDEISIAKQQTNDDPYRDSFFSGGQL